MKEKTVGLKELRRNINKYAEAVKNGEEYIVMRKSTPLFKLSTPDYEEEWETVLDFTKFSKKGLPLEELLNKI